MPVCSNFSRSSLSALAVGLLFIPAAAHADERLWIYTKSAETLPEGQTEIVVSDVIRSGKVDSDYTFHDIRLEVEHGITNRLTGYAELIVFDHNYSTTNPDLQPYYDTQGGAGGRFNKTQIGGFEVGAKYNFLSPYKDPIGLSASLAWDHRDKYRLDGAGINQNSIELQFMFQKNFLDDQLVLAFSPKIEWERRTSPGIKEVEIALDISAGASYRVAPNLYIGAEFRHQSDYLSPFNTDIGEYEDPTLDPSHFPFDLGSQHQNGNYFGPTVHFSQKNWWMTAGALWQVSGGGSPNAFNRNGKNWDEHERVHIGLVVGIELGG